jgi:uncharacterized membrane protein
MKTRIGSARRAAYLILLLMLVGAVLRTAALKREALFIDELFTRDLVMQSVARGLEIARQDLVHPPLYYLILKLTTSIWSASPIGLRALSLLCGTASIGLIGALGSRLPGARWCGVLAAACLAAGNPFLYYSQEARS